MLILVFSLRVLIKADLWLLLQNTTKYSVLGPMTLFCGVNKFEWVKTLVRSRLLFVTILLDGHFRAACKSLCLNESLLRNNSKWKWIGCQYTFMEIKLILVWNGFAQRLVIDKRQNSTIARYWITRALTCTCGKITIFNQKKSCNGLAAVNKCFLKLLSSKYVLRQE